VAFGLIVYGIVKLTNEYFSLKSQLSEKTTLEKSASTKDNGGQIVLQSDSIKLETVNNDKQGTTDNVAASQNSMNRQNNLLLRLIQKRMVSCLMRIRLRKAKVA